MNRISIFSCIWLLFYSSIWAQISPNEFENIPLLVDREEFFRILSITQDSVGFLWVGTTEGLVKYDGYDTKVYKHLSEDSSSLGDNVVRTLYVDNKGILWAGTNEILNRFNPECDCFIRYDLSKNEEVDHTITAITEDNQNNLWIGLRQRGLVRYDRQKDLFLDDPNTREINDDVTSLLADENDNLWIGTRGSDSEKNPGGLLRLSLRNGTIFRFNYDPNDSNSLSNNWVTSLLEDNAGQIWIGTAKNGLNKFNFGTEDFSRILPDPKSSNRFQPPQPKETVEDLNYQVTILHQDQKGTYWIGTTDIGLRQYDSRRKTSRFHVTSELNKNYPRVFYEDRQGQLWLGDSTNGLFRLDGYARKFVLFPKFQALQRSVESKVEPGVFWISTLRDGLFKLDIGTGDYMSFQHDVNDDRSIGHNSVRAVYEDNDGTLWVGLGTGGAGGGESGKGGLDRFNRKTETFTHYKIPHKDKQDFSNSIYAIYPDENGFLWMSTGMETILRFDKNKEVFKEYGFPNTTSDTKMWWYHWQTGGFFGAWDFDKKVVYRYDIEKDRFTEFLKGYRANSILEGEEGWYWMGTWDQGLLHYNPTLNIVEQYTTDDGLPSNNGINFDEDEEGNLWISTRKGLVKFDPKTKVFSTDGLPIDYFHTSKIKASDGQLFFGGEKGLYAFYPDQVKGNSFPPQVLLSELLISGEPFNLEKGTSKTIELSHLENNLEFSFKAIHHSDPLKNKFQYMLKPFDKDWSEESTQRIARYTNLKPGEYTLHLRAANSDGYWSEDVEAFSFIVNPPWWTTWWARVIGIIVFLSALISFIKFQREQAIKLEKEKRQQNELAQAKEIEKAYTELKATQTQLIQSEKMASLGELTAGIAHEIQNPLNFVNNFAEVSHEMIDEAHEEIEQGEMDEIRTILGDLKGNLEKISHHGQRASGIVKGMLDHSRTNTGEKTATDINALSDEYLRLAYHGLRAKDKDFNAAFKTEFDESLPKINVVPQEIGRVLLNLINNAFYAVDEKKKPLTGLEALSEVEEYQPFVKVVTSQSEGKVIISVIDNGNGIPEEVLNKIFQPFFTTKPTGKGTGLGLSMSYDIITKGHRGELLVETFDGKGTEFKIILPL